ncbi:DUF2183 domain-containing protein [Fontisphaera persica]|uniref:phosphatidate phosphatase App1 family protein n=1 Tax=Fontisphaera persica TaxID=2974023 RepID=UPI0024BFAAE1|nr:phosphatase domain-containing protein [Fontisphaera persica]WCJ57876.1 DUF2183 domain-containing protein [Fontisphaera persica]
MNLPNAFFKRGMGFLWHCLLLLGLGLNTGLAPAGEPAAVPSYIKDDEVIRLHPTAAHPTTNAAGVLYWEAPVTVHVYEPEKRDLMVGLFLRTLGITDEAYPPEQRRLAAERARGFLVDHQRGKIVRVHFAGQHLDLGPTAADGLATAWLRWPAMAAPDAVPTPPTVPLTVNTQFTNGRSFTGTVHLISAEGWTLISDIDDTIRDSQVLDRQALMQNTFCKPFRPVEGMAPLYQRWQTRLHCAVFYVSGSSWALYDPLHDFVRTHQFPTGIFVLRRVYAGDASVLQLLRTPQNYKLEAIGNILQRWPHRHYLLVGDTGERDPEVYGALARQYPEQVRGIFLRDVTGQPRDDERYRKAFDQVPANRWRLFKDPAELSDIETLLRQAP